MIHVLDPVISPWVFMRLALIYVQVSYLAWRLTRGEDMTDKRIVTWSWQLRTTKQRMRLTYRRLRRGAWMTWTKPHPPGHLAKGGPLPEPRPEQRIRAGKQAKRRKDADKVEITLPDNPWDARKPT